MTGVVPGAVLVLAKEPQPGRAKTRLTPPLAAHQAAHLAGSMLEDTLDAVAACHAARRVLVFAGAAERWRRPGFEVIRQRGRDHASRIAAAFEDAGGPAVLVGMDTPQLTAALLDEALDALRSPGVDAVLGRAADGGWWALGLFEADRRVVEGVPTSTSRTADAQIARLATLGRRFRLLPELVDVDTIEDARRVAAEIPDSRFARSLQSLLEPARLS